MTVVVTLQKLIIYIQNPDLYIINLFSIIFKYEWSLINVSTKFILLFFIYLHDGFRWHAYPTDVTPGFQVVGVHMLVLSFNVRYLQIL